MRSLRYPAIGLLISGASVASASDMFAWLKSNMFSRIEITGYRDLGLHLQNVSGDQDAFNSLTYSGQGNQRFTDNGNLTIVGKQVLGALNFNFSIPDNHFKDPQAQHLSVNYARGPWSADLGDIQASLPNSNQFASLNNNVKAVSAGYRDKHLTLKAITSQTKGQPRTVSISGANSTGPYFLQSSQIIPDSQQVMVDGQLMALGTDYVIDYEIGSITFVTRIIPPTSTILVTYEALDYNTSAGSVSALGATYDFGKIGRVGFTTIQQTSGGSHGLSSRDEKFQGFGAPSTPYFLQFVPLSTPAYPTLIRVDGIIQVSGIDYYFDANSPSVFYFLRYMPSTSNIDVVYFPKPTSVSNGDRRVIGVDYRLPLGKGNSFVSYSQATGSLTNDLNPMSGTARGVQGQYSLGNWTFKGSWRNIPATFVSVETTGFSRNENASDLGLEYKKGGLTYGVSNYNSSISGETTNPDGTIAFNSGRQTTTRGYATFQSGKGSWDIEQSRTTSDIGGQTTRLDSTLLEQSRKFGKINARYGLQLQNGIGPVSNGTDQSTVQNVSLRTVHFDADYKPAKAWTLSSQNSVSAIKTGDTSGNGRDTTLKVSYTPTERFNTSFSFTDSNSGQLATLGSFDTGQGFGYGGNGFSGGPLANSFTGGPTNVRLWQLVSHLELRKRFSLDAHAFDSLTSGSVSSNTDTKDIGIGLDADLGNKQAFSLSLDKSQTSFLDNSNSASALSLDAALSGRVGSRWNYRLQSSFLLSGGNSAYQQNSFSFEVGLTRHLSARQNIGIDFQSGKVTGYLPQSQALFNLFYEHQLYRNVSLIGSYKIRNLTNLDGSSIGAYRSHGFDLELSFNFGN